MKNSKLRPPIRRVILIAGIISCILIPGARLLAQAYVGHDECKTCHGSIYDHYIQSGHPYKLNKVENGMAPTYPWSVVPSTPDGWTWNDVTYVIGGYGWKARFIDLNGFIITGEDVQYNLLTEGWVDYSTSSPLGTKPYNCGRCHTTGWSLFEDNGGFRQDDLPGMSGTFAQQGITCEACHGPGGDHVDDPSKLNIVVDTSKELCGSCHYRDSEHRIAASSGFIKHHEQYDELVNSPHRWMNCGQCHDPHKGVIYGLGGLKNPDNCYTCHADQKMALPVKDNIHCTSCHMPLASKSATTTGIDGLLGDIHTHAFRLNVDPDEEMYTPDGKFVRLDADGHAIVKVDFACIDCHDGVTASWMSDSSFYDNARIIHDRWGNADDLGENWKMSAWLGYVQTQHEPWVNLEDGTWLYIDEKGSELGMFVFDPLEGAWSWTNRRIFPWVYNVDSQQWVNTDI